LPSLDASFSVEGDSDRQAYEVAYGATVDLALLSYSGSGTIQWSIASTSHPSMVSPTITYAGSPTGVTASFPMVADPGDGEGRSVVVKCLLTDSRGTTAVDYRVVGVPNAAGLVPVCVDEALYRDATHGWGPTINTALAGDHTINVRTFGATGDGVTNDTAAIQAAIDAANAVYVASGTGGVVYIPPGEYALDASALTETLWNFGDEVDASDGCLVLRNGVRLVGAGRELTKLLPTSPTLHAILVADGTDAAIEHLSIDSSWSAAGAGHGILQLTSADDIDTIVENYRVANVFVKNVGSYGVGLENGVFKNCILENIRTYNTGADGIDAKNRDTTGDSLTQIRNIYIQKPGQRLTDSSGLDMRGIFQVSDVTIIDIGRSGGTALCGVRFRTLGDDNAVNWAQFSSLSNFFIRAFDTAYAATGIIMGSADVSVTGGSIVDCDVGVDVGGNVAGDAHHCTIAAVTVRNAADKGFVVASGTEYVKFVGCTAVDSLVGFRNEGQNTTIAACNADTCTTPLSTAGGAAATQVQSGNKFGDDHASLEYVTAGRVALRARGDSSNTDIAIEPAGTGKLRFGDYTAPATGRPGYLGIKDQSGNARELVVDDTLVASSVSEDVASAGTSANIDIALAASTTITHVIKVNAESATPTRATQTVVVECVRSGSGTPTTDGGTIVAPSGGAGLSVSCTISGNNLRINVTNTMGADCHMTTRVYSVSTDATVEDS